MKFVGAAPIADKDLVRKIDVPSSAPSNTFPSIKTTGKTNNPAIQSAWTAGEINVGDAIHVDSYYTAGDRGGGAYRVVASATGTDDGGSFIDFTGFQLEAIFAFGVIPVSRFGAVLDNTADDTAAIQAAIDWVPELVWPGLGTAEIVFEGTARVTSPILVFKRSINMHGIGGTAWGKYGVGPGLAWDGVAGVPVLELRHTQGCRVADLRISGNSTAKPSALILIAYPGSTSQGSNQATVIERILGGKAAWDMQGGPMDIGVEFTGDFENDRIIIRDSEFYDFSDAGVGIDNPQATWNTISNTVLAGDGTVGCVGVRAQASLAMTSVHFNDCGTDIDVTGSGNVNVFHMQSEGSRRFLRQAPNSQLNIYGGSYAVTNVPPGSAFIDVATLGTVGCLQIRGLKLKGTAPSPLPKVKVGATGPGGRFVTHDSISPAFADMDMSGVTGAGEVFVDYESGGLAPVRVQRLFLAGDAWPTDTHVSTVSGAIHRRWFEVPNTGYHAQGEIAWSTAPNATDGAGWVCTVAGTPGTWLTLTGSTPISGILKTADYYWDAADIDAAPTTWTDRNSVADATFVGDPAAADGAVTLDSNDYVDLPAAANPPAGLTATAGQYTALVLLRYPTNPASTTYALHFGSSVTKGPIIYFSGGRFYFRFGGAAGHVLANQSTAYDTDTYIAVAIRIDTNTMQGWTDEDGATAQTAVSTSGIGTPSYSANGRINSRAEDGQGDAPVVKAVLLWQDRLLTEGECANAAADLKSAVAPTKALDSISYTVTNDAIDRTFDADTVTVAELADVVATLIADLGGA